MGWRRGDALVTEFAFRSGLSREILCLVSLTAKRGTVKLHIKIKNAYNSVLRGCCTELAEELDELINT